MSHYSEQNNFMKYLTKIAIIGFMVIPSITFAQGPKTLRDIIAIVISYFEVFLTLIISLAIVTFVWNVYRYFFRTDVGGDAKKEAGLYVLYATLGFFVIFSFWGLVAIVRNTFKLDDARPQFPFGTGGGYSAPASGSGTFQSVNNASTRNEGTFPPVNNAPARSDAGTFPSVDNAPSSR